MVARKRAKDEQASTDEETEHREYIYYYVCGRCEWSSLQFVSASDNGTLSGKNASVCICFYPSSVWHLSYPLCAEKMLNYINKKCLEDNERLNLHLNDLAENISKITSVKEHSNTRYVSRRGKSARRYTSKQFLQRQFEHIQRMEGMLANDGISLGNCSTNVDASFLELPSTEEAERLLTSGKRSDFVQAVELTARKLASLRLRYPSCFDLCKDEDDDELQGRVHRISEGKEYYEQLLRERSDFTEKYSIPQQMSACYSPFQQLPIPYLLDKHRLVRCAICQAEGEPGILQRMESHFHSVSRTVPFSRYRKNQSVLHMLPHFSLLSVKSNSGTAVGNSTSELEPSIAWREFLRDDGSFSSKKLEVLPAEPSSLSDMLPASPQAISGLKSLCPGESATIVAAIQNPTASSMRVEFRAPSVCVTSLEQLAFQHTSFQGNSTTVDIPAFSVAEEDEKVSFSVDEWLTKTDDPPGEVRILEMRNHTVLVEFTVTKPTDETLDENLTKYGVFLPLYVSFDRESQFVEDMKPNVRERVEQLFGELLVGQNDIITVPYILRLRVDP